MLQYDFVVDDSDCIYIWIKFSFFEKNRKSKFHPMNQRSNLKGFMNMV